MTKIVHFLPQNPLSLTILFYSPLKWTVSVWKDHFRVYVLETLSSTTMKFDLKTWNFGRSTLIMTVSNLWIVSHKLIEALFDLNYLNNPSKYCQDSEFIKNLVNLYLQNVIFVNLSEKKNNKLLCNCVYNQNFRLTSLNWWRQGREYSNSINLNCFPN